MLSSNKNLLTQNIKMIKYTKTYYLDYIEQGIKKLSKGNKISLATLDQMMYMIKELKKAND